MDAFTYEDSRKTQKCVLCLLCVRASERACVGEIANLKFWGPRNVLSYDVFFADSYPLGVLELFQFGCHCATFEHFLLFA